MEYNYFPKPTTNNKLWYRFVQEGSDRSWVEVSLSESDLLAMGGVDPKGILNKVYYGSDGKKWLPGYSCSVTWSRVDQLDALGFKPEPDIIVP